MPKGTFGASCRIIPTTVGGEMKARDHGTGRKAYGYIVHQVAGFALLVPGAQVAGSRASFFCPRHSPVVATRWSLVELTGDP